MSERLKYVDEVSQLTLPATEDEVFAKNHPVWFDVSAQEVIADVTAVEAGDFPIGYTMESKTAAADDTVRVLLFKPIQCHGFVVDDSNPVDTLFTPVYMMAGAVVSDDAGDGPRFGVCVQIDADGLAYVVPDSASDVYIETLITAAYLAADGG